jgi:hypothetical protein
MFITISTKASQGTLSWDKLVSVIMYCHICILVLQVVSCLQILLLRFTIWFSSPVRAMCYSHLTSFFFITLRAVKAGHGSQAVWGMHCLRSLGSRDRGFRSHSGHGCLVFVCVCVCVCVCVFFLCFYIGRTLRRADHPPKESYRVTKI